MEQDSGTDFISGRQVLVLMARVSLLPIQQQEVDHLLLVVSEERRADRAERRGSETQQKTLHHGRTD